MIGFLLLLFPFVLLAFMLGMQRVEAPMRRVDSGPDIETFLDNANREELDVFVREGTESALRRFRNRLRPRRAAHGRRRSDG